jgi:hypothetical protein
MDVTCTYLMNLLPINIIIVRPTACVFSGNGVSFHQEYLRIVNAAVYQYSYIWRYQISESLARHIKLCNYTYSSGKGNGTLKCTQLGQSSACRRIFTRKYSGNKFMITNLSQLNIHLYINCVQVFTLYLPLNTALVHHKDEPLYIV